MFSSNESRDSKELSGLIHELLVEQQAQSAWMRQIIERLVELVEKSGKTLTPLPSIPFTMPSLPSYPRDTQITSNTPPPGGSYTYSGTGNDLGTFSSMEHPSKVREKVAEATTSKPVPRGGTLAPVEPPAEPSALTPDDFDDLRNLINQRDSLFDSRAASDEFRSN